MSEFFSNVFSNLFGNNIVLAVVIISMLPIIELRGAIPFATNTNIWGGLAMSNWRALGWSLLGSCMVVFIVAAIFIPVINLLKRTKWFKGMAQAIEDMLKSKAQGLNKQNEGNTKFSPAWWKKVITVFIFVAVPLPFTGVWTGGCLAVFVGLDYLTSCVTVILGNVVAGCLIALILQFFPWLNNYLIYIFLGIVLTILIYELIKIIGRRDTKQ